jgi:hypothetical protein
MQRQFSPNPPSDANAAAEAAAEHTPDQPPVEITLELAICVIARQRNVLDSRDQEISVLRAMLRATADCLRPPGCVLQ